MTTETTERDLITEVERLLKTHSIIILSDDREPGCDAAPLLRRLVEEVKRDRELLRACLSHVLSSAEASRMMDGFEPREHDEDRLAAKVVDAIGDEALRALLFQNPKRRGKS